MIIPTDTKAGRFYPWDNDKYVSVTTAISDGIAKPGLNRWFLKNMAEIAARNRKKLAAIRTIPQAKEWLLNLYYEKKDNTAANLGSNVHSICEKKSLGLDPGVISDEALPFVLAYDAFVERWKPEYLESECTIFSRQHGYAGTADGIVRINGKIYIMDIKTGKTVYPEAALQMAAYRYGDFIGRPNGIEDPIPAIQGAFVLHLRPEGYEVVPVDSGPDTFDTFLSALDIFRWQKIDGKHAMGDIWE